MNIQTCIIILILYYSQICLGDGIHSEFEETTGGEKVWSTYYIPDSHYKSLDVKWQVQNDSNWIKTSEKFSNETYIKAYQVIKKSDVFYFEYNVAILTSSRGLPTYYSFLKEDDYIIGISTCQGGIYSISYNSTRHLPTIVKLTIGYSLDSIDSSDLNPFFKPS